MEVGTQIESSCYNLVYDAKSLGDIIRGTN